jgi:hypothetical protein
MVTTIEREAPEAQHNVVQPQPGPQAQLLVCPCEEIFFGGARGGGKSYGIMLDFLYHWFKYGKHARGIIFRRSMPELEDLLEKGQELLPLFGFRFSAGRKTWVSTSNGATLKMRYLDRDQDAEKYRGHSYNWLAIDEADSWPSAAPIDKLRGVVRDAKGVKCRMLLTGNPGGVGHNWLKARFIDPAPPRTVMRIDAHWNRVFIPSFLQDNKILLEADPGYIDRLKETGPPWLVEAWLKGNWNIIAGGMFDDLWRDEVHVLDPFDIPSDWQIRRAFDWGSSKPYSLGWWASSSGNPLLDGRVFPKGTRIRINELYGCTGKPNEGTKETVASIVGRIREIEGAFVVNQENPQKPVYLKDRVTPGPADPAIFAAQDGRSIADSFRTLGINFFAAETKSRVNGWQFMRNMLEASTKHPMENPGLFVFSICRDFIRTVPVLPRDKKNIDDADTSAEDHIADETRYELTTKNRTLREVKLTWG